MPNILEAIAGFSAGGYDYDWQRHEQLRNIRDLAHGKALVNEARRFNDVPILSSDS
jgi:hypothetical protein